MSVECVDSQPNCLIAVPTFKRPHYLPRILACFERLDYTNKKLVIINDDPTIKLIYNNDPRVEVINIDKQLQLSVKRNIFNCWDYDIIFPLDDDDLFLPNRLKNHVAAYKKSFFSIDLHRNELCYLVYEDKLQLSVSSNFTNSSYTKSGYFKSRGYSGFKQSNMDDVTLAQNFRSKCVCNIVSDENTIDFIYDFTDNRYHNTFNSAEISNENFSKTTNDAYLKGEIYLMPDYEAYDNIVSMCEQVIKEGEVPIKVTNHGATINRVI